MYKNTIRINAYLIILQLLQFVIPGQYFGRVEQNLSRRKLGYILSTFQRPSQGGIL